MWTGIQAKLVGAGFVLLTIIGFLTRLKFVTAARDRAEVKADTLKATVHAERVKNQIIKEEREKQVSRRADLVNQIKEKKKEEHGDADADFKGIDNLTDSDKW